MGLVASIGTVFGRKGLGYKQDHADESDRSFGALPLAVSTPPSSIDHTNHVVAILDQGATSSCVGHSCAQALRVGLSIDGVNKPELPSPYGIYYWARAETGSQNVDGGTFLRDAAKAVQKFGFPPISAWPSSPLKINSQPNNVVSVFRAAHDRRGLRGYYRISMGDFGSMRVALAAGKPFIFGLTIRNSFLDNVGPRTIDRDTGAIAGGHAMCCIGYDAERFLIVNSWGNSWRNNGLVWLTASRMEEAIDIWVMDFDPSKPGAA